MQPEQLFIGLNLIFISRMQSRGSQLQSALNSLAQLERAVEHFVEWLCDAEAALEVIEDDARRLPPREDVQRQLLQRIKVSVEFSGFPD